MRSIIEPAIIESLRAARSATEIIRFFGYPRSTVYDVVINKIYGLKTVQRRFQEESFTRSAFTRKNTLRRPLAVVERAQALISDDPEKSLRKSIVDVSEPTMRIAEKDFRYKSYTLKIQMFSEAARTS